MSFAQAQYGDATGEGEYEEGDEEEGEGEEDYEREAEDYASTTHHLVGGKRPGIQPSTALAGRMGVQHDEDFAKRVVHVATRERGWQPDEVRYPCHCGAQKLTLYIETYHTFPLHDEPWLPYIRHA